MATMLGGELLSRTYVDDVVGLARVSGKGMVGGSDAHDGDRFFLCRTEILPDLPAAGDGSGDLSGPSQIIRAIRRGLTRPQTSLPALRARLDAALVWGGSSSSPPGP
jgi:hypothetical protein